MKVSMLDIERAIADEQYHVFPGTTTTICCLTLGNGFAVTGESACVDPAEFKEEIGREVAKRDACDKLWVILGYELYSSVHGGCLEGKI